MMGCHLSHIETKDSREDPHPYLFECNNTVGESWLMKGCTSSATGRDLTHLQTALLLLDQGIGYHFGRMDTKSNVIANGISCIPSKSALSHEFPLLLAQAPNLLGCWCLLPNAALISSIVDILLQTTCTDPLTASKQLLIDPGRFTSFPGATM
jgi:hypothetical protein